MSHANKQFAFEDELQVRLQNKVITKNEAVRLYVAHQIEYFNSKGRNCFLSLEKICRNFNCDYHNAIKSLKKAGYYRKSVKNDITGKMEYSFYHDYDVSKKMIAEKDAMKKKRVEKIKATISRKKNQTNGNIIPFTREVISYDEYYEHCNKGNIA